MFAKTEYSEIYSCKEPYFKLYAPLNTTSYHVSRLQEVMRQNMYGVSGVSEGALAQHLNAIKEICNRNGAFDRTDVSAIVNALEARMKHPIDQHCAMRLGAALSFIEYQEGEATISEDPNKVNWLFEKKKEELAMQIPDLYAFFLGMGLSSTDKYKQLCDTLTDTDYFVNRVKTLREILPVSLSKLSEI